MALSKPQHQELQCLVRQAAAIIAPRPCCAPLQDAKSFRCSRDACSSSYVCVVLKGGAQQSCLVGHGELELLKNFSGILCKLKDHPFFQRARQCSVWQDVAKEHRMSPQDMKRVLKALYVVTLLLHTSIQCFRGPSSPWDNNTLPATRHGKGSGPMSFRWYTELLVLARHTLDNLQVQYANPTDLPAQVADIADRYAQLEMVVRAMAACVGKGPTPSGAVPPSTPRKAAVASVVCLSTFAQVLTLYNFSHGFARMEKYAVWFQKHCGEVFNGAPGQPLRMLSGTRIESNYECTVANLNHPVALKKLLKMLFVLCNTVAVQVAAWPDDYTAAALAAVHAHPSKPREVRPLGARLQLLEHSQAMLRDITFVQKRDA